MRIAICPGSYDPVTNGHINIIERSTQLFDKVIAAVLVNPNKEGVFSRKERVDMLRVALKGMPEVEVDTCNELVAEYARKKGATALVKGLRAMSDFEYEFQMALTNKRLNDDLETVFIITDAKNMFLSSSMVREVARFGGSLEGFVPKELEPAVYERLVLPGAERGGDDPNRDLREMVRK